LISAIVSHVTPPAYEIYCLLFLHIWLIAAACSMPLLLSRGC
jgi:hypothetical protein